MAVPGSAIETPIMYELKAPSEHIKIGESPNTYHKGCAFVFGNLVVSADTDLYAGEPGSINIGSPLSVFSVSLEHFDGTPTIGAKIFFDGSTYMFKDSGPLLVGIITNITSATVEFVRTFSVS